MSERMVSEVSGSAPPRMGAQTRTLIGVSAAHWVSHVHIMTLPPLFIIFKDQLGVSYIELGVAITLFGIVSALTQAPMGYIVDRFGARRLLIAGLCLGGCSLIVLGLFLSYPMMLACVAVGGLANCVYHPADYAILSSTMDERRMGAGVFHPYLCRHVRRRNCPGDRSWLGAQRQCQLGLDRDGRAGTSWWHC